VGRAPLLGTYGDGVVDVVPSPDGGAPFDASGPPLYDGATTPGESGAIPDAGGATPDDGVPDALADVSCDGCARILVVDYAHFYELRVPEGTLRVVGDLPEVYGDVAFTPDKKTLYGSTYKELVSIQPNGGVWPSTPVGALTDPTQLAALEMAQDGRLFAAQDDTVYLVDPSTGVETPFTTFPDRLIASGDIAFAGRRMFASVVPRASTDDELLEIDPTTGATHVLGPIGTTCVLGLGGVGDKLYGVTCEGVALEIDTTTGRGTVLATFDNKVFQGASPW
jgi:hypothetical protein